MQGNNSILGNLSQPNLNRNISTERMHGISLQMIMPENNLRARQNVRNRWINAMRNAINNNSNSNNTRTINSKKSNTNKLSTPTRKRLKKTPTTPQSKLKK